MNTTDERTDRFRYWLENQPAEPLPDNIDGEDDLCPRPFHNRGVDHRMLTGIAAPPVRHRPRGGYVCERRFARRTKPRRIRKNSDRDVCRPVEPVPAATWRAARVFTLIVTPPVAPPWRWTSRSIQLCPDA